MVSDSMRILYSSHMIMFSVKTSSRVKTASLDHSIIHVIRTADLLHVASITTGKIEVLELHHLGQDSELGDNVLSVKCHVQYELSTSNSLVQNASLILLAHLIVLTLEIFCLDLRSF